MPELPEVETIRRHLEAVLPGRRIDAVIHLDERMVKRSLLDAAAIRSRLTGARVTRVTRRGKFLGLYLSSGGILLLHLGMSGRLVIELESAFVKPHTHFIMRMGGDDLRLTDPRRFGRIAWVPSLDLDLGIDPLSRRFTPAALAQLLEGRSIAVKSALLNQSLIAGLGNIYADEALFWSGIHPLRPAGTLGADEVDRLCRAIRKVLRRSLRNRGTSFSDYVDALGHPGENQHHLDVYGREGQPCRRCRSLIVRLVVGGRSSHYCPQCQVLRRPQGQPKLEIEGENYAEV